jgi:hypothetical protein
VVREREGSPGPWRFPGSSSMVHAGQTKLPFLPWYFVCILEYVYVLLSKFFMLLYLVYVYLRLHLGIDHVSGCGCVSMSAFECRNVSGLG